MSFLISLGVVCLLFWFVWLIIYAASDNTKRPQNFRHSNYVKNNGNVIYPSFNKIFRSVFLPFSKKSLNSNKPVTNQDFYNPKLFRGTGICQYEKRLRGACLGDVSRASSLIDFELKRSKGLSSRSEAAHSALDRLQYDRS